MSRVEEKRETNSVIFGYRRSLQSIIPKIFIYVKITKIQANNDMDCDRLEQKINRAVDKFLWEFNSFNCLGNKTSYQNLSF